MDPVNLETIQAIIKETEGDADKFAHALRQRQVSHLSFSQITTVEFCPQRYYLQYIALLDPDPQPAYFTKGKLLHQLIATSYAKTALGAPIQADEYFELIDRHYAGDHGKHMHNAVSVHLENLWQDAQVVAIEEPFVIQVEEDLPPVVGVIDLILRQDNHFLLVDHKTGRDFYPQDELQMALYVAYIRQRYGASDCRFYYDQYRWVRNLRRIRKPAFQRIPVALSDASWNEALQRLRSGNQRIQTIHKEKRADKNGPSFRCPMRGICWGRPKTGHRIYSWSS